MSALHKYTKKELMTLITGKLRRNFGRDVEEATSLHMFKSCALVLRDIMSERQMKTADRVAVEHLRQVHYLSLEFLMGRSLMKNAYNLGVAEPLKQAIEGLGFSAPDLFEAEPDAGLGNGGRGRAVRLDGKALRGHARRGVVRTVYELHRGAGAPPDGKARAVRKRRGALCREYLLQRRRKEKFISGHKTNSFYDLSVFRSLSKKLRFCAKLPANRACGPVRRARRPSAVASLYTPRH